jgi:hypothetical protein
MKILARLYQMVDGASVASTFGPEVDLIAAMEVRGFTFTGANNNTRHRAELQGAPKFAGICGPMWDGDALRYEDQSSYAAQN